MNLVHFLVRLATTLNVVQSKLAYLQSENGISRRRVRELELELEDCKVQVAKERSKVLDRERIIAHQQDGFDNRAKAGPSKGIGGPKNFTTQIEDDGDVDINRYKEAVEEKKGQ